MKCFFFLPLSKIARILKYGNGTSHLVPERNLYPSDKIYSYVLSKYLK